MPNNFKTTDSKETKKTQPYTYMDFEEDEKKKGKILKKSLY